VTNHRQVAMATGLNIGTLRLLPKVYLGFGKTSIKADGREGTNYFIDVLAFFFFYRICNYDWITKIRKKSPCV